MSQNHEPIARWRRAADRCRVSEMVTLAEDKFSGRHHLWNPRTLPFTGYLRSLVAAPLAFAVTLNGYGDPPARANPPTTEMKLLLGQPLSSWTASYGPPKSDNGKNAVFRRTRGPPTSSLGTRG